MKRTAEVERDNVSSFNQRSENENVNSLGMVYSQEKTVDKWAYKLHFTDNDFHGEFQALTD